MTNQSDPNARPPFWQHRYYYLALKIVVLVVRRSRLRCGCSAIRFGRVMSKERLYLFDTTLRDGAQTTGVDFSLEDKRLIARTLDELGIDYIEGGYPGANVTDTELFAADAGARRTPPSPPSA